jgi:hypothetical protein
MSIKRINEFTVASGLTSDDIFLTVTDALVAFASVGQGGFPVPVQIC